VLVFLLFLASSLAWASVESTHDPHIAPTESSTSTPLNETSSNSTSIRNVVVQGSRVAAKKASIYDHKPLSKLAYAFKGEFYGTFSIFRPLSHLPCIYDEPSNPFWPCIPQNKPLWQENWPTSASFILEPFCTMKRLKAPTLWSLYAQQSAIYAIQPIDTYC